MTTKALELSPRRAYVLGALVFGALLSGPRGAHASAALQSKPGVELNQDRSLMDSVTYAAMQRYQADKQTADAFVREFAPAEGASSAAVPVGTAEVKMNQASDSQNVVSNEDYDPVWQVRIPKA